jgi:mitochondrial fission protein ELM1
VAGLVAVGEFLFGDPIELDHLAFADKRFMAVPGMVRAAEDEQSAVGGRDLRRVIVEAGAIEYPKAAAFIIVPIRVHVEQDGNDLAFRVGMDAAVMSAAFAAHGNHRRASRQIDAEFRLYRTAEGLTPQFIQQCRKACAIFQPVKWEAATLRNSRVIVQQSLELSRVDEIRHHAIIIGLPSQRRMGKGVKIKQSLGGRCRMGGGLHDGILGLQSGAAKGTRRQRNNKQGFWMQPKIIWALTDERQGNTSQTLGVAEALGLPFETRKIRFNGWTKLPNFLLNSHFCFVDNPEILPPSWPDLVIGCARRLGIVMSAIKRRNPATFTAMIQWPGWPYRQFDLIAAPLHDKVTSSDHIITTLGAPHRVTQATLATESVRWKQALDAFRPPYICVLVGGSTRGRPFGVNEAKALAGLASDMAKRMGASLLVTTSRRTSAEAANALSQAITAPCYFHAWDDNAAPQQNPFYGFLGVADAVIVTGDSISMCSEACATGKPVYIYSDPVFVSSKHQMFLDELYRRDHAHPLQQGGESRRSEAKLLNESAYIASEILKRYAATKKTA